MSIKSTYELQGMQKVSDAVALTLMEMKLFAKPGMSTKKLDDYGGKILSLFGARSAPFLTYKFPGWTCISIRNEFCHGIPSDNKILKEGDLINIDVSAELGGFWADNGGSFVLGKDLNGHDRLVKSSHQILNKAISTICDGVKISELGKTIESGAQNNGYTVIRNLGGHGVGKKLHEKPYDLVNYFDRKDFRRFKKNDVLAVETFISTHSTYAVTLKDGWTLVGDKGGYMAQHEHTIMVTDGLPIILTEKNGS